MKQQVDTLEAAQARIKNAHILIVKDNSLTQFAIQDLLNLVGTVTIVVNNEEEALERLATERFDLVLIDIPMSAMKGLETTRRIRENQAFTGQRIIAMVSNATPENCDQYLAADLDDFIAEPIDLNQLVLALGKWIPGTTETQDSKNRAVNEIAKERAPVEKPPLDITALYRMFHNNTALVHKIGHLFIDVAHDTLSEMQIAQANKDLSTLSHLGHKLKSSARTIGASSFADLCEGLERANADNDWPNAKLSLSKIPILLERIVRQLEQEFNNGKRVASVLNTIDRQ